MAWTSSTLAAHLASELAGVAHTSGDPATKLVVAVNQAGASVWNAHPWRFRREDTTYAPYFRYSVDEWSGGNSSTTVTPTWPSKFDEGWLLAARWYGAMAYGHSEIAKQAKDDYETWLKREIANDETMLAGDGSADEGAGNTINGLVQYLRTVLALPRTDEAMVALRHIVRQSGIGLWAGWDWRFRAKQGTLTVTAGDSELEAPTDFGELDQRWLRDYDDNATLRFTETPSTYQQIADTYDSTDTGAPRIACFVRDTDETESFIWKILLSPTSDADYSYKYWYVVADPWTHPTSPIGDTGTPIWPETFNEGWRLLARMQAAKEFKKETYEDDRRAWTDWLGRQLAELNETITTGDSEYIEDGYGDAAFMNGPDSVIP